MGTGEGQTVTAAPLPAARGAAVTLARLEDQIAWYDRRSGTSQRRYMGLKLLQLATAAAVPVMAALDAAAWLVAAVGAAILLLEGLQQLGQYQQNWIGYRSTCEQLKHEKYLHAAAAGPYAGAVGPDRLLAERLEGLISQEHAKWVGAQDEATQARRAGADGA